REAGLFKAAPVPAGRGRGAGFARVALARSPEIQALAGRAARERKPRSDHAALSRDGGRVLPVAARGEGSMRRAEPFVFALALSVAAVLGGVADGAAKPRPAESKEPVKKGSNQAPSPATQPEPSVSGDDESDDDATSKDGYRAIVRSSLHPSSP